MKKIFLVFTTIIFLLSCNRDGDLFDPTYFGEGFKGITFTGEDGPTPYKADPTDWYYYLSYTSQKINGVNKTSVEVKGPNGYMFGPAYPNPTTTNKGFSFRYSLPAKKFVKIYLIDNNYTILAILVNSELEAGNYEYRYDQIKIPGVYRLIMETEGLNSKGDIWIKSSSD